MMGRRMKSAFVALFLWALAGPLAAEAPHFDRAPLSIQTTAGKAITLDVEWAITPEQRERLFLPFAAGHPGGGSGLGLAICHGIVQSLGGSIELENHGEGPGLDARVRLPLARDEA